MNNVNTAFKLSKYVFKYVPTYGISKLIGILLVAFRTYLDLYIIEHIVELLEVYNASLEEVLTFIVCSVALSAFVEILNDFNNSYIRMRCRHKWIKKIQYVLFNKTKDLHISCFDNADEYDKLSRAMNQDLRCINCYDSLFTTISTFVNAFVLVGYIATTVPILFVITLVASSISLFCYYKMNSRYHKLYKETEINRRQQAYVGRGFYLEKFAMDIKTTNMANLLLNKQQEAYEVIEEKTRTVDLKSLPWYYCEDFVYQIVNQFIVYVYLMYYVFFKNLLFSKFIPLSSATIKFNSQFYRLSSSIGNLNRSLRELSDFMWLMNYQRDTQENLEDVTFEKEISLNNVSFKYQNEEKFSLSDINMKITKGEKIAIIGYNGAGKTTLTKLMLKLYNPDSGELLIDEKPYLNFKDKAINKQFVTVLQNFQIYCASVSENILMREVETKEDEDLVVESLKKVGLYDKINALPGGINTMLTKEFSQDGLELSGGERQKLAIARVFASSCQVAILDEPTSALDPIAEKEINDQILDLCGKQNKTIILISHRLSTIVNVDCIYMLKEGRIIEQGSHLELMQQKGAYYEMFEAQAKLYKENIQGV